MEGEEEWPGPMPQEMYDTLSQGDTDRMTDSVRSVVRVTKRNSTTRMEAQATARENDKP